jgi:hypothetical protein
MVELPLSRRWLPSPRTRTLAVPFDPSAAITVSLVTGTLVLIAWWMCSAAIYDESPWKLPRMMAAVVAGPGALSPEDEPDLTLVATGIVLHFLLALGFGAIICFALRRIPDGAVACAGAAMGAVLYAIDLHGMTAFFPWFAPLRTPDTFAAHILFGIVAATAYRHLVPARR